MSLITINQSASLSSLPDESILRIFEFLDIKSLGSIASVCKLFTELQDDGSIWHAFLPHPSFRLDLPKIKDRVYHARTFSLGSLQKNNSCVLNLGDKTITQVGRSSLEKICLTAFSHSDIPKGSFVVYSQRGQMPGAVIKNKHGDVCEIKGLYWPCECRNAAKLELQACEGTSSPFSEFKLVLDPNEQSDDTSHDFYVGMRKATQFLKGIQR